jgi:GNAT superfamily N-acetyltransferase
MDAEVAQMTVWIREVDGTEHAELLQTMNGYEPETFPPLENRHFADGSWWIAQNEYGEAIGFAGLVGMLPFEWYCYMKRAYVHPDYRGRGIQMEFISRREQKARELGYIALVSECSADNISSRRNFLRAGFEECNPEQCWGAPGSVYFIKRL